MLAALSDADSRVLVAVFGAITAGVGYLVARRNTAEHNANADKIDDNTVITKSTKDDVTTGNTKLDLLVEKQTALLEQQTRTLDNQQHFIDGLADVRRDIHYIRTEVSGLRTDVTDIHGAIVELRDVNDDNGHRITKLERHHPGD
jgi:prophage DNA circulation protein